jgi:hypothetical protein
LAPVSENVDNLSAAIEEIVKEEQRKTRPSPMIVVYCDKHLGVKMAIAEIGPQVWLEALIN